jgi:hypothetical protein
MSCKKHVQNAGSVKSSGDVFSVKHRVLRLFSAFCIVEVTRRLRLMGRGVAIRLVKLGSVDCQAKSEEKTDG